MRGLYPQANIVSIPNGVDLAPFIQKAARPPDLSEAIQPQGYFLFLGRLKERKGVDVLLQALARMSCPASIPLVVAGAGEERPALEQLRAKLGLDKRVHFVGSAH